VTTSTQNAKPQNCDVLILGSGLAGSSLGAILARNGAKVVLIDAANHPRFAVGESMIPQLVAWLQILAARYDVPELLSLTDIGRITKDISNTFGIKRHFGFMVHRPGEEPDPRESNQFVIPDSLTSSSHLFRQDSDAFMFRVAAKYGCETRQGWRAVDLDFDDDGVTVTGQTGEVFRARYLVDASGFRSPLAEKFSLREEPSRFKHHSRSLFTHMIGIKPFDEVSDHPKELRPPAPWHEGTMHHMFERGWFWIIPFDNYKDSRNPLCSVGLTFDERMYPKPDNMTAEEEFNSFLEQFPAVKRQFEGAHRVREWVSTGRLQYSSTQTIGDRWCLMSHAAGFIDPLYSRGLSNTFEVINALSSRLIGALKDDDFSAGRFEYVERLEQGLLEYNDELVNCSFIAFSHFKLWDAVFRLWGCCTTPATMRLARALMQYRLKGNDESVFEALEHAPYTGLWWPDSHTLKRMLDSFVEVCEKYEIGELDGDTAADLAFDVIRRSDVVPGPLGWKDRDKHFIYPRTPDMAKFMYWATRKAPPEIQVLGRDVLRGMATAAIRRQKIL
jgi:FADH2 O2-dependent halogenase